MPDTAAAVEANTLANFKVIPTGAAVGAEIRGLNATLPIPDDVKQALRDAWAVALARALGDGRAGRHLVATAERGWRSAVREERRAFARGRLSVRAYARLSLARLWWAGLASDALLQACGARSVRPGFRSAFGHLVACLQCTDDAFDADEDRRVRGASVPDLIGLPAAALARASVHLARSGGEVARRAGLHRLARWLRRRGAELELRVGASPGFGVELAALGIAEACAGEIERMPPFPDLSLTRSADRSAHRPTASGSRAPRTPRAASPAPSARRVRARS